MENLVPIVGDVWEEKGRSLRTVRVVRVAWRGFPQGGKVREVTYQTLTTPGTRAQRFPTVTDLANFQKRFRKQYNLTEDLSVEQ